MNHSAQLLAHQQSAQQVFLKAELHIKALNEVTLDLLRMHRSTDSRSHPHRDAVIQKLFEQKAGLDKARSNFKKEAERIERLVLESIEGCEMDDLQPAKKALRLLWSVQGRES